ncbi:MAG: site-2 protease family protein, partial [bacterium]|nr:site-2 protease family protein [bacterium]
RRWRVRASLPYFIPFPPPSPIGTMGAVIKIKSRIPNRRALMDIGAAGPIAGFVVAVLALGIGLHYSTIVPNAEVSEGALQFGDSLLSGWMSDLILGPLPPGYDVYIHPVGFAGWLGLFVTVLNLLPMGQFDGGHIVYAIFGRKHRLISHSTLLLLALFWAFGPSYGWLDAAYPFQAWWDSRWPGWLVWIFMALILGRQHPPPSDPYTELDRPRMIVGCLSLVIFVLCFIPRPISIVGP